MDDKNTASVLKKLKQKTARSKTSLPKIKNKFLLFLILLTLIILVLIAGYFLINYQKTKKLLDNPTVKAAQELEKIINNIDKFMELPKGETPSMYGVADKSKLPNQNFYKKAENGDKVLIYLQAKKAILYRPSTNKVIEVGPITTILSPTPATSSGTIIVKPTSSY